ncbi:branched-chain amino acid ABC transporter permease [Myxococcus xanthus]|uniref:branched-chain amino acid ABC transporter permease n=1 Tax=Myxococcus xanthus TaxID=34 RepID=UPI0011268048|nr:branched-chain amino acid ABC transporter permease [Myxococcus xanthus]QDE86138.1 ABC transporter permease [Myxococcus xanthus]QDF00317.1 ABC transporter permease [Myxococcus xanthus]QDF08092.1 ABC transporter permease [Myxococcus xanthus]
METPAIPVPQARSAVPASLRGLLPVLLALPVLALFQWLMSDAPFASYLLSVVGVNIILAVSLNIVNGMTGQFSIGHAGFMAVGAYISGVLSLNLKDVALSFLPVAVSDQVFFVVSLLVGGLAAALCGFLVGLPSLRLRGDYLAIVTLGFGEIIRVVVQNTDAFGRALGLSGIPQTSSPAMVYFFVFLTVLVARRITGSSHGRSLWAIREDEVAAEAMGVDTTGYKVRAFVISSFFAGIAGALFAHFVPIINPGSFTFVKSMEIVVMVVLGGLGSTTGAIIAATFLTLLPEGMRSLFTLLGAEGSLAQKVDQIRMPVYGLLLVVLMLARPQGLFGTKEIWDVLPRWIPRKRRGLA